MRNGVSKGEVHLIPGKGQENYITYIIELGGIDGIEREGAVVHEGKEARRLVADLVVQHELRGGGDVGVLAFPGILQLTL